MKRVLGNRVLAEFSCAILASLCLAFVMTSCNSNSSPPPPISVQITPVQGGATVSQSVNFTANLQNDGTAAGVTWTASTGTFSSQGKTTATYVTPNATGSVTVTATSLADSSKSASATIGITDLTGVTTYHNDLLRDGANTHEFALTTSNVKTATFGKLFSCAVDGAIYAQPLWVANLMVGGAKHNVVIVATQHDSVYAFDADSNGNPCVALWHANLLDSSHGGTANETSVPSSGATALVGSGFGDINPEVGVTGTPVIDPSTSTLYVVSKSVSGTTPFFQRLHALDLTSGNEKLNGNQPVVISATVAGTGDGSAGGQLAFDPQNQHQRPGLALINGQVFISWASHEDHSPYHGWVIAYNAATLAFVAAFNTTPNGGLGGIWMSGAAPAFDSSGNCFLATGNGTFTGTDAYGDSIVKLGTPTGGNFPVLDFFTPSNQATLNANDTDLGAGGVLLLPDPSPGAHPHLLVQVGKNGTIFLINRDNGMMGEYCNACAADNVVQEITGAINGMWGTPAYWNSSLYFGGAQDGGTSGDSLKAFSFNAGGSGMISTNPTSLSANTFYFSGPTPSVSSNGSSNGIVWALDNSEYGPPTPNGSGPAVLHAYDAINLAKELWNSSQGAGNAAGFAVKFTVPTVANGKVYVGTRTELDVYGLLPN